MKTIIVLVLIFIVSFFIGAYKNENDKRKDK